MKKGLAIFDLDRTWVRVNSSFHFASHLLKRKFLNYYSFLYILLYYARYKYIGISLEKMHRAMFSKLFKGRSAFEVEREVAIFLEPFLEQYQNLILLDRFLEHRSRGDYTVLLSSSPDFLVFPIAKEGQFDFFHSSSYLYNEDGIYEALGDIVTGEEKLTYVQNLQAKLNTPSNSIFIYTDSIDDLPLLKNGYKIFVVQPDRKLKKLALKNEWEVL